MANEISATPGISVTPSGGATMTRGGSTITISLVDSAQRYVAGIQTVGTSEEALNLGEVAGTTLGWAWFKNLDATNFVSIKTATSGTIFAKLKAGEACMFRFGSGVTAPYVIADTASVRLEYTVFVD